MAVKRFKNGDVLDSSNVVHSNSSLTTILNRIVNIGISVEDKDLNECIGTVIIGYGNGCNNRPNGASNGYFINIPHPSVPDAYNKQLWLERSPNTLYIRNQEDGVWSTWTKI